MPELNGLVLTGGQSSRMGHDKSLIDYHGKPQREHLTDLLKPYCQTVFWSVNARQARVLEDVGQPLIVDQYELLSPLNGILSAFQTEPTVAWLVVACDMPLLTTRSIEALLADRDPGRMATVFRDSDGQLPEPLLGIYEPAFGPVIQQAFQQGVVSPRQLLRQHPIQLLHAPAIRELLNVNDPEALKALKQQG